ncbi:uncharacterized protein RSE6_13247 [Rhynchosporium secalis]|uniref:Rhodopsin domain-containing protein n=1 Tax=Rhynchosporium secalis TaxID=38038 RepID=A0A1E1MSE0_RHYSE|nr:uncharacterized protein RSE6_13247 [Rhynchosporium secalis]
MDTSYIDTVLAGSDIDPNDHSSMSRSIIWTSSVLYAIVLSLAILRIIVRTKLRAPRTATFHPRAFGWDDYLIMGATVATGCLAVFSIVGANLGLGKHIMDILRDHNDPKLEATQRIVLLTYGCWMSYAVANALTKLSIIASCLRIFLNPFFRSFMWFMVVVVTLQGIASCFTIIFECDPAPSSWDWTVKRKSCIDIQGFFVSISIFNVLTDFAILVAPAFCFWKIQMARKKKVELIALYSIGLVGCLFGLFRLGKLGGLKSLDITYTGALPLNNSMAEISFGIICACIPPLRPALRQILQGFQLAKLPSSVTKDTPANTPEVIDTPRFEHKRRPTESRIEETGSRLVYIQNNIELEEFDEGPYRQYMGSSMTSLRPTPSESSTIHERGSATSVKFYV